MRIRLNTYLACVIVFLCASTECIYPQKLKWNFGLSRKQSSEVIPHSKHSFQTAKPKKKVVEPGELSPLSDWEYQLSKIGIYTRFRYKRMVFGNSSRYSINYVGGSGRIP